MLAVPSWAVVDHEANEPSDLFAISDAPVLQALGLYRELTLDAPQEVTATFPG
jgi:gentisate 1,2-dioxygenase